MPNSDGEESPAGGSALLVAPEASASGGTFVKDENRMDRIDSDSL